VESGLAQRGYHLDIVGDGPLHDSLLVKHGASQGITFHGRKRQEEVVGFMQRAFLLLHPSDHESFGLTILEAMAAGVPVIMHDLSSVSVWAKEHPRYAAFLDRGAWEKEILKFEQAAYWERISAVNLAFARGFGWDCVAERVMGIIGSGSC
jgi:glycosyltransferase involved in cell wall biosynthesis